MNLGILVFGDNHLILRGPPPTIFQARAMARHWSLIQLGEPPGTTFCKWTISTNEFRENLTWAIVTSGTGRRTTAVDQLLNEMSARGINICETL
jgi:hypothetical protein